jgi:hypothetical protein
VTADNGSTAVGRDQNNITTENNVTNNFTQGGGGGGGILPAVIAGIGGGGIVAESVAVPTVYEPAPEVRYVSVRKSVRGCRPEDLVAPEELIKLGQQFLSEKNYAAAESSLRTAVDILNRTCPDNLLMAVALEAESAVFMATGRPEMAQQAADVARQIRARL